MNIQQSVLRISVISLGLLCNGALFGMKCDYKGTLPIPKHDIIKKLTPEIKEYLVDYLHNPIVFGETNKENHTLVKYQGLRNFCLAQEKDPSFVLSHYVPILLIDRSNKRDCYDFCCLNSYKLVKMSNNFYYKEDIIIPLRNKRLKHALKQKKFLHGDDKVKFDCFSLDSGPRPLTVAALSGDSKKILHELDVLRKDKYFSTVGCPGHVHQATVSLIAYPSMHNNNALEILVSVEKEMRPSHYTVDLVGFFFYGLLFAADKAKNKKAFRVLVTKCPDDINIIWVDPYAKNRMEAAVVKPDIPLTTLDRMIEESGFDSENIELFRQCGGKTMKDLTV